MKKLLIALCLAVGFSSGAYAAEGKALTAQQSKMGACNKEAGDKALKGDERKKFMSECLKAKGPESADEKAMTTQQSKMGACNKEAGDKALKGDERKKFMSECLKAKSPAKK